jgi:YjbR protein
MTANVFRKMALGFPGTVESAHMSHPDFRVEGRIFATLGYPDDSCGMVKLTVEQQRTFIKRGEGAFRPCNGVWGQRGATNVHLASVKKTLLKSALRAAIGNALANAKTK